jgi:hypothetical protein
LPFQDTFLHNSHGEGFEFSRELLRKVIPGSYEVTPMFGIILDEEAHVAVRASELAPYVGVETIIVFVEAGFGEDSAFVGCGDFHTVIKAFCLISANN